MVRRSVPPALPLPPRAGAAGGSAGTSSGRCPRSGRGSVSALVPEGREDALAAGRRRRGWRRWGARALPRRRENLTGKKPSPEVLQVLRPPLSLHLPAAAGRIPLPSPGSWGGPSPARHRLRRSPSTLLSSCTVVSVAAIVHKSPSVPKKVSGRSVWRFWALSGRSWSPFWRRFSRVWHNGAVNLFSAPQTVRLDGVFCLLKNT